MLGSSLRTNEMVPSHEYRLHVKLPQFSSQQNPLVPQREFTTRHPNATSGVFLVLASLTSSACGVDTSDTVALSIDTTEGPFRSYGPGTQHSDITEDALTLLNDEIAEDLGDANEDADNGNTKYKSEYHFDNCRVGESFGKMRFHYEKLVVAHDPDHYDHSESIRLFGEILHLAQDFYAHSNWVESGQSRLVDSDGFAPPKVGPGSRIGTMVGLAVGIPSSWDVTLPWNTRVPFVATEFGTHPGLITGTYEANVDAPICDPRASIPHGKPILQPIGIGNYLAKDDPDSPYHSLAVTFAKRQTTEEFCRLARLVILRYGNPGFEALHDRWGVKRARYLETCSENQSLVAGLWMAAI